MDLMRRDFIFDVGIVSEDFDNAIDLIAHSLENGLPFTLVFLNSNLLDYYYNRKLDLDLKNENVFIFPDGVFLDLCNILFNGKRFKANLNGTDVCPKVLELLDPEASVSIVGGDSDLHNLVRQRLSGSYDVNLGCLYSGFFRNEQEKHSIINDIIEKNVEVIFVAMGNPLQENFVQELRDAGFQGTAICVGAFFNFFVGLEKRAPRILRMVRMEWFYRFVNSPRRLFKRYFLAGPRLFLLVVIYNLRSRFRLSG